ncbi:MAG: hypothetical protein SGJ21_12100 [Alphaproteobacteria bacterium]|nr:hypothetical protein [Alphaproteobacteria bacterium]
MRAAALAIVCLALGACQPQSPDTPVVAEPEATGQDAPDAPQPPAAIAMKPVTFEAMSKTAEAFTGAISLTAVSPVGPNATPTMILESASGLRYETRLVPGGAAQASAIDWSSLFNTEIDLAPDVASTSPSVDVHVVTSETAPDTAVNGGLCGVTPAFAIAMAVPIDAGAAGRMMSLAAFSGDQWPPNDESRLCGVFNYVLP